jgi:hypothetical protein
VVISEMPGQRRLQDADLGAHHAPRHLGEHCRIPLPGDQRAEHRPAGDSEDVADHRRQLQLGVLEQFLRSLLLAGSFLDEGAPVAAQVPQLPLPPWRDEAGPQHAALCELGQPDAV